MERVGDTGTADCLPAVAGVQRGAGYGIIAKIQEPEYHVVTSPITKDLDTVERLVQRLNQEQTPVRVFEERYLLGNLLDLMKN